MLAIPTIKLIIRVSSFSVEFESDKQIDDEEETNQIQLRGR